MIGRILFLFTICNTGIFGQTNRSDLEKSQRTKKQFSLFTIVSFPNDQCTASSGSTTGATYGTCLSTSECSSASGTVDGNCAAGFGVCCVFKVSSCGSSLSKNCTYIQNPSYSSSYTVTTTTSCSYTLTPLSTEICQIRLDFDTFSTTIASTTGTCTDSFKITGNTRGSNTTPNLCGTLSGQHMYFENGRSTSTVTLAFEIATTTGVTWSMKVSQIECSSRAKAPEGCAQWLTGSSGTVKSFGWATTAPTIKSLVATYCIRRERGFCAIQYSRDSGTTTALSPTNTEPAAFALTDATLVAGGALAPAEGAAYIHNALGDTSLVTLYFSTQIQTAPVALDGSTAVYATAPFRISQVATTIDTGTDITGFYLQYHQIACGSQLRTAV